jgi:hypothetical protein
MTKEHVPQLIVHDHDELLKSLCVADDIMRICRTLQRQKLLSIREFFNMLTYFGYLCTVRAFYVRARLLFNFFVVLWMFLTTLC